MEKKHNKIDRRNFLKTMSAAGLAPALAGVAKANDANSSQAKQKPTEKEQEKKTPAKDREAQTPQVPRRKLGKTGVDVPCLSLGFGRPGEQVILRKALLWGIDHWETSLVAAGGNSELSLGKFIADNPEMREKLFIVTKESESKNTEDLEKCLQTSLKRLNTKYIDLYFGVYMMQNVLQLTDEVRQWAESAKKRKLIRFFGFSTHQNMAQCLFAAAKAGWIDAVQTAYNFRVMQDSRLQDAIGACHEAGVGVIAMKTQGMRQKVETEADKKLIGHFTERGFTEGQAKIKAVLKNEGISSACSSMTNNQILTSNVAAVLDRTELTSADMGVLKQYAQETCSGYCAGCSEICDSALGDMPYVSDVMRYLMYYNSYGDHDRARQLFAQIPAGVRSRLLKTDYRAAEALCPQRMPIAELMTEAVGKLA